MSEADEQRQFVEAHSFILPVGPNRQGFRHRRYCRYCGKKLNTSIKQQMAHLRSCKYAPNEVATNRKDMDVEMLMFINAHTEFKEVKNDPGRSRHRRFCRYCGLKLSTGMQNQVDHVKGCKSAPSEVATNRTISEEEIFLNAHTELREVPNNPQKRKHRRFCKYCDMKLNTGTQYQIAHLRVCKKAKPFISPSQFVFTT